MTNSGQSTRNTIPIRLDRGKLAGEGLEANTLPDELILKGLQNTSEAQLFDGEFIAFVWQGDDGILLVEEHPFDQFVQVLNGTAILTEKGGSPQEFNVGDSFIVPKGFTGTWEIRNGFREFIIFESNAYKAGIGAYE